MEPCSCTGLMSAVPPFAAAAAFIASTDSRLSQDRLSATSLDVDGGIGRLVNMRHFACVTSMSLIASLQTMHAAVSSVKRGRSEEHTSELQSLMRISYAVFCLKKNKNKK